MTRLAVFVCERTRCPAPSAWGPIDQCRAVQLMQPKHSVSLDIRLAHALEKVSWANEVAEGKKPFGLRIDWFFC